MSALKPTNSYIKHYHTTCVIICFWHVLCLWSKSVPTPTMWPAECPPQQPENIQTGRRYQRPALETNSIGGHCVTLFFILLFTLLFLLYLLLYNLLYLPTPWARVYLEKLTSFQLVKKFPAFCGTRSFITAFTSARHLSLSWVTSIQSMPSYPTAWSFILILCYYLGLSSKWSLSLSFPTKTMYTHQLSPIRAKCPAHLILLDLITRTILSEEYRSLSSSLCSFLHSPVISSLLDPNILFSTLFSNTLSLRSSLIVGDQVSRPYKTTGKIIFLYNIIFAFLDSKLEDKRFCTEW